MIRLMAAARTAVLVCSWLIGAPVVLVIVAGSPIPSQAPSIAQAQTWLQDPLNPVYQAGTARMLAWSLWALLSIAILVILALHLRAMRWQRIVRYLPPPAQSLAAAVLGTAVVATSTSSLIAAPVAATTPVSDLHDGLLQHVASPTRDDHQPASGADRTVATHDRARLAPGAPYTVKRGDSLWRIATTRLGEPTRWHDIYQINRGHPQPGGHALTDPDEIDIGWRLTLPAPRSQQGAPGTPRPSTTPTNPHRPASSTPTSASARPDAHGPADDGVDTPTDGPAGTATAAPTDSTLPPSSAIDTPEQARATSQDDGVDVPGGWITLGLGSGLIAATAMVWRHRRHRYQPTPVTSSRVDDADLLPPLAAMTRIRTSLRRHTPGEPATAPVAEPGHQTADATPPPPPPTPRGTDLAGMAELRFGTGLGLTGDGALDAARGLLIAALASGNQDDPDAKGGAIIAADTAATLLGVAGSDLDPHDRLTVATSALDALTRLEEEIIRRSRLTSHAQVADVRALRDTDGYAESLPQLLLITEPPDPTWATRLATAAQLGCSVDISAVVIGDWPSGTTISVAADGSTGIDSTPRLSVLDSPAALEMLTMLSEAHDGASLRPQTPPAPAPPPTITQPGTTPASGAGLPVTVRVLGRPGVIGADGQPSPGIRAKAVELLVYLAVNRHGADLNDIMEALYPDANLRRAGERLSTVVADLRKHIRRAAATPADTAQTLRQRLEPVPNTGSRYHLDPAIVRVDWWTVLDQYEAVTTTVDTGRQLAHITAAIEAAGGALADDVDYDWVDTDREVVRRHRLKLHVHAAALLAGTDPHRSWLLLEQACAIDPLSDELARTTMHAAARLGDADAIRHRLTTLRESLEAHGLEITADTEQLAHDLARQAAPPIVCG